MLPASILKMKTPSAGGGGGVSYLAEQIRITVTADGGGGFKSCATLRAKYGTDDYSFVSAANGSGVVSNGSLNTALDGPIIGTGGFASASVPCTWTWTPSVSTDYVGMALTAPSGTLNRCATDITVESSNDNFVSDVTVLSTISGQTGWAINETRRFTWASGGSKAKIRARFTAVDGGSTVAFLSMRFFTAVGTASTTSTRMALSLTTSNFGGTSIQDTLDANTGTGWTSATSGTTQVVTLDFAKTIPITDLTQFHVEWTSRSAEGNRSPVDYTIEILQSGSWTNIKTKTGNSGWGSIETRDLMQV